MKSTLHFILLSILLLLGPCQESLAQPALKQGEKALDKIVAIVNDSVITQTELNQATRIARNQMAAQNMSPPETKALHKQILDQLINNKLQLEAAEQLGIQVKDAELDQVIKKIAEENHLSIKEFYDRIAHEGLSSSAYRKQIRESLILQHLQQREVAARISISPEEINDSLRTTQLETTGEKEYHLQDILIPLSDSPNPQEIAIAKKFADELLARLRKGITLQQLPATEVESVQTNDLSWRKLDEVPTAFTELVNHMQPHSFSGPVQTANGFHLIQLLGLRSLQAHSSKPERQEVAQAIFQRKFEEAMQTWLGKARGQAFIEIDDKASA
ncbi:MAG TPA: SurA N-terminal domain-containing protein [Gammaproteobacteria bacterium]|nr:SurA N-terminal domain-containing protein [Gammaproteobacteria bacterium]